MRDWVVGGALIVSDDGLLLVRNRRRNGSARLDPAGGRDRRGRVPARGADPRGRRRRPGLRVTEWAGPVYEVRCEAPDLGWTLRVEAHLAVAYEGELHIDDPDGIVVDACFVAVAGELDGHLDGGHPWVLRAAGRLAGRALAPRDGPALRLPRRRRRPAHRASVTRR